jgi:hypothetical protein
MPHYVPNAFKGSDRCDYQSTVVWFYYLFKYYISGFFLFLYFSVNQYLVVVFV